MSDFRQRLGNDHLLNLSSQYIWRSRSHMGRKVFKQITSFRLRTSSRKWDPCIRSEYNVIGSDEKKKKLVNQHLVQNNDWETKDGNDYAGNRCDIIIITSKDKETKYDKTLFIFNKCDKAFTSRSASALTRFVLSFGKSSLMKRYWPRRLLTRRLRLPARCEGCNFVMAYQNFYGNWATTAWNLFDKKDEEEIE